MQLKHRYAVKGGITKELLTYQGRIIVHDNRLEMAWLFGLGQGKNSNLSIVEISARLVSERATIRLRNHPDIEAAGIRFPLNPAEFKEEVSK